MVILYVYKITNTVNGKMYIGKHSHRSIDNNYYGSGIAINKAIKKYGRPSFVKEILCVCENECHQNEMEIHFIEKFNTFYIGYNMTKGGEGALGLVVSEESKIKISNGIRAAYLRDPSIGKRISEKSKKRVGCLNPFFGKKLTPEHIEKMKVARVLAITGENNPSAVKLRCKETGVVFNMAKDAAAFCGFKYSTSVLKCAKGKIKSAGGYTWELV